LARRRAAVRRLLRQVHGARLVVRPAPPRAPLGRRRRPRDGRRVALLLPLRRQAHLRAGAAQPRAARRPGPMKAALVLAMAALIAAGIAPRLLEESASGVVRELAKAAGAK